MGTNVNLIKDKTLEDIGDAFLVEKQHHAYTKGMVLELKRALTESQKETLHQKYMRCRDLAKSCDYAGEVARYHDFGSSPEFYARWKLRWLDIARGIKEYIDGLPVLHG